MRSAANESNRPAPMNHLQDPPLTIEDIAALMHIHIITARERVRADGFPAPLRGSGPRSRLWSAGQVNAYMLGHSSRDYAQEAVSQ